MWNPFHFLFDRKDKVPKTPEGLDDALYQALYVRHECPDCSGEKFTMGPQGGMCQNIKCANDQCGSEFNLAPFEDGQWLDTPFFIDRTKRSETDSKAVYGRGYGPRSSQFVAPSDFIQSGAGVHISD